MMLRDLCERHPEYMGDYWERCEALYKGGPWLLENAALMQRVFPKHNAELPQVYADRLARAFYINYAGTIVDGLVAGLESDPLRLAVAGSTTDDPKPLPDWWSEWGDCVTAPGADLEHTYSLHGIVCEALRRMLVKQSVWILADLPRVDDNPASPVPIPTTLAEQEAAKLRDPYLCVCDADSVIDWDTDDDGTLLWAMMWETERRRTDPTKGRGLIRHTWTLWTAEGWERWQLDVDPARPPRPDSYVQQVDKGPHPFGCVPLVRAKLPDGLWAMGKLESLAREHLNKRAAVSWAEYKSLFPILYEFMGAENPAAKVIAVAQKDPGRATNQTRGQGWTQRRGADDRAEFVGPPTAPFTEARASCSELMQEMHRVTKTMAASANMDSKALQRSGDSKEADNHDTMVVLEALGMRGRAIAKALQQLVAAGRSDKADLTPQGMQSFDLQSVTDKINEAVQLFAGVPILSPTFKRLYLQILYQLVLSDHADQDVIEEIREELQTAIEAEGMMLGMGPGGAPLPPGVEPDGDEDPNADPEAADDDGDEPAAKPVKRAAGGGGGRMFGTGPFAKK
jgi:hypothetical protein